MYVHGTGEHTFRPPATLQEVPIGTTQPAFTVHARQLQPHRGQLAGADDGG
jgi:hypothetical protein